MYTNLQIALFQLISPLAHYAKIIMFVGKRLNFLGEIKKGELSFAPSSQKLSLDENFLVRGKCKK